MKLIIALIFALSIAACQSEENSSSNAEAASDSEVSVNNSPPTDKAQVRELGIDEFKRDIETREDIALIDVRTSREWDKGRIPGSLFMNINDSDFREKLTELDRDQPVYFYCASGVRSKQAMDIAVNMGFENVAHFKGGMNLWSRENYEVERD